MSAGPRHAERDGCEYGKATMGEPQEYEVVLHY